MSPTGSVSSRPFSLATALAVTALGILAMVGGSAALATRSGLSLRAQIALGTLLLAMPAVAALTLAPTRWPSVRGPAPMTKRTLLLSVLLGAALWVGSAGLMEVQSLIAPMPQGHLDVFRALHRALAPRNAIDALVSILVIAVLPGVCEELVLRGVCLPSLFRWLEGRSTPTAAAAVATAAVGSAARTHSRSGRSATIAAVATALLFAAIHLDAYRFLFVFVIGLVFGFLRLALDSLWPSVFAHLSLNTLTFLVAPFVDDPSQPYTPSPTLGVLCLVTGVAAAWPLLRALGVSVDSPGAAS